MKIIIDATNIKTGGGLTHLKQLLENKIESSDEVELIGGDWLNKIDNRSWLEKTILTIEFSSLLKQEVFKIFGLSNYLSKGDIAFIPGGTFSTKQLSYVSMSQNMLVFENEERNRFPKSFTLSFIGISTS